MARTITLSDEAADLLMETSGLGCKFGANVGLPKIAELWQQIRYQLSRAPQTDDESTVLDILQDCVFYIDTTWEASDGEEEPECSVAARKFLPAVAI